MSMVEAIREVEAGRCQRICVPGQWKVWRDSDGVHFEVLS